MTATWTRRAAPAVGEIRALLDLSWPLMVANLVTSVMTATDMMILARWSGSALAAGGLGFNLYFPLLLFGVGAVSAASPMIARALGANPQDLETPRIVTQQSVLLSLALAAPIWVLLWNAEAIFGLLGQPAALAEQAAAYLRGLQWALLPNFLFFALRSVLAALERPGATLLAGVLAVGFNLLANWALVFGNLGFPALGAFGSGLATSCSQLFMLLVLIRSVARDTALRRYRLFSRPLVWRPRDMSQLWRLGAPIGAIIVLEVAVFAVAGILMGWNGPTSVAAHAITYQIVSLGFMMPLAVSQAATVRVGYAFGACDRDGLRRAGRIAFVLVMAMMVVFACAMLLAPHHLVELFVGRRSVSTAAVVPEAASLIVIAAVFQLFNGAQAVGAGVLRGLHDTRAPALLALCGYWIVGVPSGAALTFLTDWGSRGMWVGLTIGFAVASGLLFLRWRTREVNSGAGRRQTLDGLA